MSIRIANSRSEIEKCFGVVQQLRPHLSMGQFIDQVGRQIETANYTLAYSEENEDVKAVVGYRVTEFLAWGKVLFIDDLVTDEKIRGKRFGGVLLDWVFGKAKEFGCNEIHLESGVHRFDAHRFYLAKRMNITCHHFAIKLK